VLVPQASQIWLIEHLCQQSGMYLENNSCLLESSAPPVDVRYSNQLTKMRSLVAMVAQ